MVDEGSALAWLGLSEDEGQLLNARLLEPGPRQGRHGPALGGRQTRNGLNAGGRDCGSTVSDQGGALRRRRSGRDQEATG